MRHRISSTLWGILFIIFGIGVAGKMAGIWEFGFFAGWWTLFLIIPSLLSIIEKGICVGNTTMLLLGAAMLACCQGYLSWDLLYQMAVPALMIIIGLVMIVKNMFHLGNRKVSIPNDRRSEQLVVFSGKNAVIQGEFYGMDGDAIFGGLTIDLRGAQIVENVSVDATAVFGGVDVLLPAGVNVKVSDTSLFGGCDNHRKNQSQNDGPTVYINAIALFGGVEVK